MLVYRCGEKGNLIEQDGGMLVVELHIHDIFKILVGAFNELRFQGMRGVPFGRLAPVGWAPEDKFQIESIRDTDIERDSDRRLVRVRIAAGGDITLRVHPRAGEDEDHRPKDFLLDEIGEPSERFRERGLLIMRVTGLGALESERRDQEWFPALWDERAKDAIGPIGSLQSQVGSRSLGPAVDS